MEKSWRNVHQKLVPDPFLILLNNQMDKVIENKRGLELVNSRSSGHKTNSEKFLYSLYII